MEQVKYLELEVAELRKLLVECELQLRIRSDMVMRLQREPLTEERVYALYRRSLDWRVLARDVEAEHGVNPVGEI
jgi:hypothetical protein